MFDTIERAMQKDRDIGAFETLRRYERARKGDVLLMQRSMDVLHHLFLNEQRAVQQWRNRGMQLVNRLTPLKSLFMRHATGRRVTLPSLMQLVEDGISV